MTGQSTAQTTTGRDQGRRVRVPRSPAPEVLEEPWPTSLLPAVLDALPRETPFLAGDASLVTARVERFRRALPGVDCCYAVKCNPDPHVLRAVLAGGGGFEIASAGELDLLTGLGVDAASVLYSNPVKPAAHVARAAAAGVWRFSADSEGELDKLARVAPGSAVHVRVAVEDHDSVFPLSRKFGVSPARAAALLLRARGLGLRPHGLTFHVGSQCTSADAWTRAIASLAPVLRALRAQGVVLGMLDVGGGLPAWYGGPRALDVEDVAAAVERGLEALPYRPAHLVAEPGRWVVAETAVMVASVIGRERRGDEEWLYTDVGGYHGMIETQQTAGGWRYPLWTSRSGHGDPLVPFVVTGPTCDSSDTMFPAALLPATLREGDRLHIGSAGAYTLSYASHFNGFPPPAAVFVG